MKEAERPKFCSLMHFLFKCINDIFIPIKKIAIIIKLANQLMWFLSIVTLVDKVQFGQRGGLVLTPQACFGLINNDSIANHVSFMLWLHDYR
jgi:hypothetical protein